jgi:RNA polymerase sigma factor, sigma-70 family
MTDAETDRLLRQTYAGDENALFELYSEFKDAVFHFALSITGNYHDSQDILQDTFIRLRTGAYKTGNAKAYIFRITRNLALSCLRARKRSQDEEDIDAVEDLRHMETGTEVAQMLQDLAPAERQIVLLHVLGGFTHREIAGLLSMPAGTVMWKYHRAIAKLKNTIGERGNRDEKQADPGRVEKSGDVRNA